jgi:vitamin B12 transporter
MKKTIMTGFAICVALCSQAQDTLKTLGEVVVTANKFQNKSAYTGKVITVVTREDLEKKGGKDLAQVLTEQTGIYINGAYSNPGKDKSVYLRGARVDHTLIMVDGVPLYDPSGIGSNFDIRLLSVDQIERIEVLKGSQSTLYGSDAMAGVIHIITRKPSSKKESFMGSVNYGSFRTLQANAGISGKRNKIDYQLQFSHFESRGINETIDTSKSGVETDLDAYNQQQFQAGFTYAPNASFSVSPYVRYSFFRQSYDQGAFTDERDLISTNSNKQWGVRSKGKMGKLNWNLTYNFNWNDRKYTDDSVLSRNGFDIFSRGNYRGREHFADLFAVYPLMGNKMKITGGVDYRSSSSDQEYLSIGFFGPYLDVLSRDSLNQNQLSAYVSILNNIGKNLHLEWGGRVNKHSTYGTNGVFNINPSFLFKEKYKFFANLSSAYKTPTLFQLFSQYGNKSLKPEKALTWEAGFQYYASSKKWEGRITYFNRSVKDAIAFFFDPSTFNSFYINQDKQNDQGVELEAKWNVSKKIDLVFNGTFLDGYITTKNAGKDTSYFNLIRRPKTNANLIVGVRPVKNLYLRAGLMYTGKREDLSFDASYNAVKVNIDGYAIMNIYAEWNIEKQNLKWFADVRNLTNTKYTEVYGFNTPGINWSTGLRFQF